MSHIYVGLVCVPICLLEYLTKIECIKAILKLQLDPGMKEPAKLENRTPNAIRKIRAMRTKTEDDQDIYMRVLSSLT